MSRFLNAWITGVAFVISTAEAMPALSEQLAVGQTLMTAAEVSPEANAKREPMLLLTLERMPDAPVAPLSLEVRLADSSGKPSTRSVLLTTLSFFGVPPGQVTTFAEPLPPEVLARAKDGKLPLELRLKSSARAEVAAPAKVEIKRAVVEAGDAPAAGSR
jgi:hypothetical protein